MGPATALYSCCTWRFKPFIFSWLILAKNALEKLLRLYSKSLFWWVFISCTVNIQNVLQTFLSEFLKDNFFTVVRLKHIIVSIFSAPSNSSLQKNAFQLLFLKSTRFWINVVRVWKLQAWDSNLRFTAFWKSRVTILFFLLKHIYLRNYEKLFCDYYSYTIEHLKYEFFQRQSTYFFVAPHFFE